MNSSPGSLIELVPLESVAVTSTVPEPAGAMTIMDLFVILTIVAGFRPKLTDIDPLGCLWNSDPMIVTCVPAAPLAGAIEVTTGASF